MSHKGSLVSLNPETNPALLFPNLEPLILLAAPLFAMPEDDEEEEDADEDEDDGDENEDEEDEGDEEDAEDED
ncbi:MAG: hypothetical protein B7Z38_03900 [Rhodobacterales bacterium 12-64-8]|nr:MAG: hypothetical protein B7Z38_03900 [Rhodobacterales bacterium 12-64-8]OYX45910.1 MAG: hypothetical protein B7Y90_17745 [Alphaproteobacteria bacterium 32-64-14]